MGSCVVTVCRHDRSATLCAQIEQEEVVQAARPLPMSRDDFIARATHHRWTLALDEKLVALVNTICDEHGVAPDFLPIGDLTEPNATCVRRVLLGGRSLRAASRTDRRGACCACRGAVACASALVCAASAGFWRTQATWWTPKPGSACCLWSTTASRSCCRSWT